MDAEPEPEHSRFLDKVRVKRPHPDPGLGVNSRHHIYLDWKPFSLRFGVKRPK